MVKVKICGITNLEDAEHAIASGADAIGFNFVESSPRYITPGAARNIVDKLNHRVDKVGVFADQNIARVFQITVDSFVDVVQFHGDEPVSDLETLRDNLGLDVIKAFRMPSEFDETKLDEYSFARILLDGYSPKSYGGTGVMVDWEKAKIIAASRPFVYLAGGLNPDNVANAVSFVRPHAVDVASGVESSPGKKDHEKVTAFIAAAKGAL